MLCDRSTGRLSPWLTWRGVTKTADHCGPLRPRRRRRCRCCWLPGTPTSPPSRRRRPAARSASSPTGPPVRRSHYSEVPRYYTHQDGPGRWFLNRATLLRPDALTGGVAQRGGCAAPAAVWPCFLRGLPQPHAPVRRRAASTFGNRHPQKLQTVRSSEVQQKAVEESLAVDDKKV